MTLQEQQEHFQSFTQMQETILLAKGDDYSTEDRLSNFKHVAAITNLTPEIVSLVQIGTKIARLGVLLQSENNPKNESINDSVIDLANYTFLLDCILKEKQKTTYRTSYVLGNVTTSGNTTLYNNDIANPAVEVGLGQLT